MTLKNACIRMLCFVFLPVILTSTCDKNNGKLSENKIRKDQAGGPCSYSSFTGTAVIIKIIQTSASREQAKISGGPGYEGFEVWLRFVPDSELPEEARFILDRQYLFTLHNSWYVGPQYIEKYGLTPDRAFPIRLKIIQSGPCTPIDFEFPTLDRSDYFETRSPQESRGKRLE